MGHGKQCGRVDTLELKALIVRRIGHQRAEKYFDQLKKLFASSISKSEFNRLCTQTIGRETIPLHNQLIRSILKNACLAQSPPCHQKGGLQSLHGFAFPPSPRKIRSLGNRSCKFKDRPSPLGPLGKPQTVASEALVHKTLEQQSPTELQSLGSKPPAEIASVEDGEEVEQLAGSPGVQSRSPVTAPLGISVNFGGTGKSIFNTSPHGRYNAETCLNRSELPDTSSLRSIMERKLEMEGIKVSVNCANLLNNAVDAYLKRLIGPCISLAGSKHGYQHSGRWDDRIVNCRSGMGPGRSVQSPAKSVCASVLDLRSAMELNPEILGENWSVQLEKISSGAFSG
ncbi:hypothetical protein NL676_015778 [Syzygium grande]|nr:hypothetical protein NL676_015778 [Syzygium grande]